MDGEWPIADKEAAARVPTWLTGVEALILCGAMHCLPPLAPRPQIYKGNRFYERERIVARLNLSAARVDNLTRHFEEQRQRLLKREAAGPKDRDPVVYFLEAIGLDLVKIGWSGDYAARFQVLSAASPAPLRLLFWRPGKIADERALHARFADSRMHGEWFRRTDDMDVYFEMTRAELYLGERPPSLSGARS